MSHIVEELRPLPPQVDPEWEEQTLETILARRDSDWGEVANRWRRPARILFVAAAVAAIIGSAFAARGLLPSDDRRSTEVATRPEPDGPAAKARAALRIMDADFPTVGTDATFDAVGTRDFSLGIAPGKSYVFYKLGFECADGAKYRFILNGDRNSASGRCDATDRFTSTAGEMSVRVEAGSTNVVTIEVNQALHYTLTVGYRETSIYAPRGPSGTLPDGRTYGGLSGGFEDAPDLIRVEGASGVEGYVDVRQLREPMPRNPKEALAGQNERKQRYRNGERVDRAIPVVDTQGRQVDVFNVMLPVPGD